jgi:hypothetical protein
MCCCAKPGSLRTTGDKRQYPLDIARENGHKHLFDILSPQGLPEVSEEDLLKIEIHCHKVVLAEAGSIFKPNSMRLPDLCMLRDNPRPRIWMPVPGMYGVRSSGLSFHFRKADHTFPMTGFQLLVGKRTSGHRIILSDSWRIWQDKSHYSR